MKESEVEKYLHNEFVNLGGTTRKWVSPGRAGVPDRICFLPMGRIFFIEVKTDTGKTTIRQEREIACLQAMGCKVLVAYGREGVDCLLRSIVAGDV